MRASDDLFQLIKSLTKSEKRYFKLFASLHDGEKKYLLLFDAIDAQTCYDEAELKERFRDEKFVRQLNVAKKYLWDQILKSLRVYHSESSVHNEMKEAMRSAEILNEKGLKTQAAKILEKVIATTREYELFGTLLDAYTLRASIRRDLSRSPEMVEQLFDEQLGVIDDIRNTFEYRRLFMLGRLAMAGKGPRTQEELDELIPLLDDALLRSEENATTVKSRIYYNWTLMFVHYAAGKFDLALTHARRMVELFERKPEFAVEYSKQYLAGLTNRTLLLRYEDPEEFWRGLETMRDAAQWLLSENRLRSLAIESDVFESVYINQLAELLEFGEFERCRALVPEIVEGLERYGEEIAHPTILLFYHHIATTCIGLGDFGEALGWLNRIVGAPVSEEGARYYYSAQIMSLLVHFELEHYDLLEHLVRSTHRFLRQRNALRPFETAMLAFFRKAPGSTGREEMLAEMRALHEKLTLFAADPVESQPFGLFHYLPWLEGRIEGRSFEALVRERASQSAMSLKY